jgi:cysteine desulfurase
MGTPVAMPVFLDNLSTTRTDPRVVEAMLPYFTEQYGNAASRQHEFGWRAEAAVEIARKHVAALVGGNPEEVIFTSGATESINLALRGIAAGMGSRRGHVITAATEHRATLDTCAEIRRMGIEVEVLKVDGHGLVDPDEIRRAIKPSTVLVSIMTANNEIGTIAPVEEIGAICRERGVLFHTDAAQAAGRIPIRFRQWHADLLSVSAHKMHGPKGVGALLVVGHPGKWNPVPQITGGGHERGIRSGTLNVPGIVGFGEAARIAQGEGLEGMPAVARLRDQLVDGLRARIELLDENGHPERRLPVTASLTFIGARADRVMMQMKEIAVSTGSACSSAEQEVSHVLRAIGLNSAASASTIRFGLSRYTTEEEIARAVERTAAAVSAVKARMHAAVQSEVD